jgi:hypothetical protein
MVETLHTEDPRSSQLVRAAQIARDAVVRQSPNGVRFATFGETGVADLDLDRMLQAVPTAITAALNANTYFFVPLAMREPPESLEDLTSRRFSHLPPAAEPAMVASAYTDEFSDAAICHRNVELGHGKRGVFISTRLMGDRFALSFEFFINVAHAFVDQSGVPPPFADLVWKQALDNVRGETSIEAWESRNVTFGRPADAQPEPLQARSARRRSAISSFSLKQRSFIPPSASAATEQPLANQTSVLLSNVTLPHLTASGQTVREPQPVMQTGPPIDEKERGLYLEAAFSDAVAIYLLSLVLDFDYSELREREYPLLSPAALAARLRTVGELYPANPTYEFAVRYRRKA